MQNSILNNIESPLCMKDFEHAFTIESWVQVMYIAFSLNRSVYIKLN